MSDTPEEFRLRMETPEYSSIPEMTRQTLYNYYAHRYDPGSGIRALLEKNIDAVVMVDAEHLVALPAILRLFYNSATWTCWGSKKTVTAWLHGEIQNPEDWPAE